MSMDSDQEAGLVLSLGRSPPAGPHHRRKDPAEPSSLTLSISDDSSFSTVKKEVVGEEAEVERVISTSRTSDDDDDGAAARKKLRLTKEQSALLEDRFKEHSTLNPKQKQALAKQLSLRPRQVEVWFQNRRARTKLKQTEVDCEFLKRCCETLTDENRRLQKEVNELRAMKYAAPPPLYMQLPAATLTMCPSCERVGTEKGGAASSATVTAAAGPFVVGPPKTHFFNPFTHSATC